MTTLGPRRPKKLIVCCDGTWMNSDIGWKKDGLFDAGRPQNPSNVTRLVRALKQEDSQGRAQIAYYQAGVGTSWSVADKFLGGGLAYGLSENVREAYGFLVNNYFDADNDVQDDQIYFFGFSRGAFTARSVAGMCATLGLITKSAMRYFYQIFQDFENAGDSSYTPQLPKFLQDFKIEESPRNLVPYLKAYAAELRRHNLSRPVKIIAVGVFDTVGSLGLPVVPLLQKVGFPTALSSYRFFDTGVDDNILNAFHVMALDEHRSAFSPTVWSKKDNGTTNLKQIWMPGVHTNIGGGNDDTAMSDISLAWIADQIKGLGDDHGLEFDDNYFVEQFEYTRSTYQNRKEDTSWGLGKLGNSMKFPTNMAGSITRTPMGYHITDYWSGRPSKDLLQNTHEKIHVCVRARWKMGLTYDGQKYQSAALKGWGDEPKETKDGKYVWERDDGKVLVEDDIGYYERMLISLDAAAKKKYLKL